MHTVTVATYNRPDYLRCVLMALATAMHECPAFGRQAQIVIGIDPGGDRQQDVCAVAHQFADMAAASGYATPALILWPEHLGVSEHPRRLLQHVFTVLRSEFNVHLEDDTVLSPDALRLAYWYQEQTRWRPDTTDKVICLSLHARSNEIDSSFPELIHYRPDFGVWGWCCTHIAWWLWLSHYWNVKRTGKLGFDWSLSWMMHKNNLWVLSPSLSRVQNIGREGGVHQTPEGWDEETRGIHVAGPADMTEADKFVLDDLKPPRPKWIWGD